MISVAFAHHHSQIAHLGSIDFVDIGLFLLLVSFVFVSIKTLTLAKPDKE